METPTKREPRLETPTKRELRIEAKVGVVVWSEHCFMFHATKTTTVFLQFFFFTTEFLKLLCLFNTVLKIILNYFVKKSLSVFNCQYIWPSHICTVSYNNSSHIRLVTTAPVVTGSVFKRRFGLCLGQCTLLSCYLYVWDSVHCYLAILLSCYLF